MPSPFPGMDPFLEHPAFFPDLHDSLIIYLREQLQERLPEPYYATSAERAEVELSQRHIGPNVAVLRAEVPTPPEATATQPVVVSVPTVETRETYLEIFARRDTERLVAVVEVLSPSNKTPGDSFRERYLRKQREVFNSQVNLVEIDLLRMGVHTTRVPLAHLVQRTGPFHYHACVWRFDQPEDFFVYPFTLADRMPALAIPLLPGDEPVAVDLQAVYDRAYDTGPFRRRVPYAELNVVPALNEQWMAWVRDRLRAAGRLPPG